MKKLYLLLSALFIFSISIAQVGPILGDTSVCVGSTITLSNNTGGGIWSSFDTSVASVDSSGVVTGNSAGTTYILYTVDAISLDAVVTVNPRPSPIAIGLLVGYTANLFDNPAGGVWTYNDTTIAIIDTTTDSIRGIALGTDNITYTANGCYIIGTVTVYDSVMPITGDSMICTNNPIILDGIISGGIWMSSDTTIAQVDTEGLVTGMNVGTAIITYEIDTNYLTKTVAVIPSPAAIYGDTSMRFSSCGSGFILTVSLSDSTAGGIWSSSDTNIIVVDSSGLVSFVPDAYFHVSSSYSPYQTITYTLPDGCYVTKGVYAFICTEGIPTIQNQNTISIFPNPATSQLTIQSTNEPLNNITITNILGQTIYTKQNANSQQLTADCSLFPSGIYFVKVNGSEVRKFVKE